MRTIGTVVRGVRAPIFQAGDDLAKEVCKAVLAASEEAQAPLRDRDVIAVTESVVARTQGNYATLEQIAADVRAKIPAGADGKRTAAVVFPILSRNRFSMLLKGISMGVDKLYIVLKYPSDEVGNELISLDRLEEKGVDPYRDVLTEAKYRELFGENVLHPFTGMDYVKLYREYARNSEILLANDARAVLPYAQDVIACDIHTRARTVRLLKEAGARTALTLADLLNAPVDGSGYNPDFGLYGSNLATENSVKLFPRDCEKFVEKLAGMLRAESGKQVEVMVYGDGAFKDPVGKIWELADPVVSPGYTKGLEGQPNELKLKYLADNDFADLSGDELKDAIEDAIKTKDANLVGQMVTEGTTPRRLTDLLGSLCDLTSGSGDKGTPIIYIQGYFDNYTH